MKNRKNQKCIYCDNILGEKGSLGMCNKHYIQYKRHGDPLHADKKPRATVEGYYRDGKTGRREHRVIYEKHYGIKLTDEQIIHHINFVKTDNRIENLWLYENASEHIKAHREYDRLMSELKDNQEIVFDNGKYAIRERERERERLHSDRQSSCRLSQSRFQRQEQLWQGKTEVSAEYQDKVTAYLNRVRIDKVNTKVASTLCARDYKGFGTGRETMNGVIECRS